MVNSSVLLGSNEIIYTKKPLSVVKKQQLEPDMEQQTGSKSGKEDVKAVYLSSGLSNLYAKYIMWNARLDDAQPGIKIVRRIISNLR